MNKDLLSGLTLVVVACGYYLASRTIAVSSLEDEFGPHGLPNILSVLLALVGALLVVRSLLTGRAKRSLAESAVVEGQTRPLRAIGLLAIGFAYIWVVGFLGYAITIALLLASIAWYEGIKMSWRVGAVAVIGAAFFWLLFVRLLEVAQPEGVLF